jgi:hypothetical protein
MADKVGTVILAGRSPKEGLKKWLVSQIYQESYISGINKAALRPLSLYLGEDTENKSNLDYVVDALSDSLMVDNEFVVTVGLKDELSDVVNNRTHLIEQGNSLGENMVKGNNFLQDIGYKGDHVLYICGDIPLISGYYLDLFFEECQRRGSAEGYVGIGSRKQLRQFVTEKEIEQFGEVRDSQFPKRGYLNKFGIPLIDDSNIFYPTETYDEFVSGNTFLIHKSVLDDKLFNTFYHNIKFPWNLKILLQNTSLSDTINLFKGRWTVSQAEEFIQSSYGYSMKLAAQKPEFMFDTDSHEDFARNSYLLSF